MSQKIYSALIKAKAEFKAVHFDKANPHFRNKFSSLKAIEDATQEALSKYGMTLIQPWSHLDNGDTVVETIIIHESGEFIKSSCVVKAGKTDQQFGASITYMRRYQAASLLGVVGEEDDDGEGDRKHNEAPKQTSFYQPDGQNTTQNPPANVQKEGLITEKQGKMLYAITKDFIDYRDIVKKRYGELNSIPYADFQKVLDHFNAWKQSKQSPSQPKEGGLDDECPF